MSKFFTVVTAADQSMDGKSFFSGQAKTADKSIVRLPEASQLRCLRRSTGQSPGHGGCSTPQ